MKQKIGLWVLYYFRFLSRLQLRKFSPDIVGIVGSAGKTTTQRAVMAVLTGKYKVKANEKANSESGIPLNILGLALSDYSLLDWGRLMLMAPLQLVINWLPYEKYIVEMGIDSPISPKNMDFLLSIIQPRVGIFLNVLPVHTEQFSHLKGDLVQCIGKEKGKMVRSLPATGLAIINADDPIVVANSNHLNAKRMTFGREKNADVRICKMRYAKCDTLFEFEYRSESATLSLPYLLPEHFGYSFAAALCLYLDEGGTLDEGCTLLKTHFVLPPGRMSLLKGIHGSTIIDSSYNASAKPTIDALKMMEQVKGKRKLSLLGDMRELGPLTSLEHTRVIEIACTVCDELVLVGPLMRAHALPHATGLGFRPIAWFETADQAANYLKGVLKPNDLLLVKGSQNTLFLETAVERLLLDPRDQSKLCRRNRH